MHSPDFRGQAEAKLREGYTVFCLIVQTFRSASKPPGDARQLAYFNFSASMQIGLMPRHGVCFSGKGEVPVTLAFKSSLYLVGLACHMFEVCGD